VGSVLLAELATEFLRVLHVVLASFGYGLGGVLADASDRVAHQKVLLADRLVLFVVSTFFKLKHML